MPEEKITKRGKDTTQTPRQKAYLVRLEADQGKRLVVDLDGDGKANLEFLLSESYGQKQKQVVQRALAEAADRVRKKKKT